MDNLRLTNLNQTKWWKNVLIFISPVIVIYVVAVIGVINANNGAVEFKDFFPTPFTLGAGTLYLLNSALDYIRKLKG